MKARTLLVPVVVAVPVLGGVGLTAAAGAAADAPTTVTIKAEGTDLSGRVTSTKPKKCADDRKVVVWKVKGERGGGDDIRFASDRASWSNGAYRWSTGNTGTEGRFYARVRHIDGCKGDSSPTVRATRND